MIFKTAFAAMKILTTQICMLQNCKGSTLRELAYFREFANTPTYSHDKKTMEYCMSTSRPFW